MSCCVRGRKVCYTSLCTTGHLCTLNRQDGTHSVNKNDRFTDWSELHSKAAVLKTSYFFSFPSVLSFPATSHARSNLSYFLLPVQKLQLTINSSARSNPPLCTNTSCASAAGWAAAVSYDVLLAGQLSAVRCVTLGACNV